MKRNNRETSLSSRSGRKKRRPFFRAWVLRGVTFAAAASVLFAAGALMGKVLAEGLPNLSLRDFLPAGKGGEGNLFAPLLNTARAAGTALILAVPAGVFAAVYRTEYGREASRAAAAARLAAETLAGIPSIVYGLFGFMVFSVFAGLGYSLFSGAATLALMTLPLILRETEEALAAVPRSYREGSLGLGAGRWSTLVRVILPAAAPGIAAGILLAAGRMVGETAALLYTAGTASGAARSLLASGRTLAVHLYALFSEGLFPKETKAAAAALLLFVIAAELAAELLLRRIVRSIDGRK